jgi:hypothetical protein
MWRRVSFGKELSLVTLGFELRGSFGRWVWRLGGSFVGGSWCKFRKLDDGADEFEYDFEAKRYRLKRLAGETVQRASWLLEWEKLRKNVG